MAEYIALIERDSQSINRFQYCFWTNEKADEIARQTVNNPMTEMRSYSSLIDMHIET